MSDNLFLIRIATDYRVKRLVKLPILFFAEDEVSMFPKSAILCDACNACVDIDDAGPVSDVTGYALCDSDSIIEVVCEVCRKRYFPEMPVLESLDELDEADGGE